MADGGKFPKKPISKRTKKSARDAAVIAALSAATLTIGVGVCHDVFTRPEHTIDFANALLITTPASVTLIAVRNVFRPSKKRACK